MLEKVDLAAALSKKEYKTRSPIVGARLTLLQRACWEARIPVIVLFEGWDASGKGTSINLLTQQFDPRGFRIHPIRGASDLEKQMPWLWRFWLRLPNYGEIAIFDRSWYGRVLVERVEKLIPAASWREAYQDILEFERTLADDGTVMIKLFLHISKDEQKRRFKTLEKDPLQNWRVTHEDWGHHRKYDDYLIAIEEMLARTESEWAPWVIVGATDRYWARLKILEVVSRRMEEVLIKQGKHLPSVEVQTAGEMITNEESNHVDKD
jgi:polyphosphate kinase 2 (PPK2 family)